MTNLIETYQLSKAYPHTTVVDRVNLHIPQGKIYGLLGRNGAGKTTLMKILLQLVKPTSGHFNLFNETPKKEHYRRIGSLIESPGFYDNLTAYENLHLLQCYQGNQDNQKIYEALKTVNLHHETKKVFSDYSLGMKQRLGIAAAIFHQPQLLILDEPTNGLDPIGISQIRSLLVKLCHENKMTILISSHILSEIEHIADIIGIIHHGRLIEEIPIDELKQKQRCYLSFDVNNPQHALECLLQYEPTLHYRLEAQSFKLYGCKQRSDVYNRLLIENHIAVHQLRIEKEDLENYFSDLIEGNDIG